MAKDNFDFDTESKAKFSLDFSFFKNLTQKQKETILMIAIAVVAVIVIVVVGVILMTGGNNGGNNGNNGGTVSGGNGENNVGNNGGDDGDPETPDVPDNIIDFYISSEPTKVVYFVNDIADYSGLSVFIRGEGSHTLTLNYSDAPDEFTITGFDSSEPVEEQTITVTCRGFTDTFKIKIEAIPDNSVKLERIYINPLPKTEYKVGESLNLSGAKLIVVYSDGTEVEKYLTLKHISGFNAIKNTPGVHDLTVRYFDDNGQDATTILTITITE